jgi:hypothetical protein
VRPYGAGQRADPDAIIAAKTLPSRHQGRAVVSAFTWSMRRRRIVERRRKNDFSVRPSEIGDLQKISLHG